MSLDENGLQIVTNLREAFSHRPEVSFLTQEPPVYSLCSVGLELEIPWRAYFPALWERYFCKGQRSWTDFSTAEQKIFTEESQHLEDELLSHLRKTLPCGLGRGRDWYWEFILPPVHDVRILAEQIAILSANNLCIWGPHSLQPTIGKLRRTASSYSALLLLELAFVTRERLLKGISRDWQVGWARKGVGGIACKASLDLEYGDQEAIELRTTCLPSSISDLYDLLLFIALLSDWLYEEQQGNVVPVWREILRQLTQLLNTFGLPLSNWLNPHENLAVWHQYVEVFDEMKKSATGLLGLIHELSLHKRETI